MAGFPDSGIVVDTDPGSGRLLGRNGTIYFIIEGGKLQKLRNTASTGWARFLPDGNVLLSDERTLRVVTPHGEEVRKIDLPAEVLQGQLSTDGKEAVLLTVRPDERSTAGLVHLDLQTGTVTPLPPTTRSIQAAYMSWIPGSDQLRVMPDREEHWLLDVKTGATQPAPGAPRIYSPDGRWLVDFSGGKVSLGQQGSAHRVVLADALGPHERPMAFWTADSRHVLLPGGQVIEADSGKELGSLATFKSCAPIAPVLLGKVGTTLVAAYVDSCH